MALSGMVEAHDNLFYNIQRNIRSISKELPKNPLELDGAGAVADIGLHDQVVLVTRSQDHSSAVCRVKSYYSQD